jgi:hypothetical protein
VENDERESGERETKESGAYYDVVYCGAPSSFPVA